MRAIGAELATLVWRWAGRWSCAGNDELKGLVVWCLRVLGGLYDDGALRRGRL